MTIIEICDKIDREILNREKIIVKYSEQLRIGRVKELLLKLSKGSTQQEEIEIKNTISKCIAYHEDHTKRLKVLKGTICKRDLPIYTNILRELLETINNTKAII